MPTVLILDDRPADRELMTVLLAHAGHRVIEAQDAEQALQHARAERPDLVITDILMPQTNGYEFVRLLRQQEENAHTPVVFCTANYVEGEVRALADAVGVRHFLEKPYTSDAINTLVGDVLESSQAYPATPRLAADFEREHVRVLNDKLVQKVGELDAANDHRHKLLGQLRKTHEQEHLARQSEQRIRSVLAGQGLQMVFQPIFDLQRRRAVSFEALARFELEPRRPPNAWFDEAAQVGLGAQLELEAARRAVAQLDNLPPHTCLSVNASPRVAQCVEFLELVVGSNPQRVIVELTEHERIDDYDAFAQDIADLRAAGARVAVDDAGAGFASLQYILRVDPDIIKLDLEITRDIDTDERRQALAVALISFAQKLGTEIVAEGIETEAELQTLRSLGVTHGQGYHLGRPAPLHHHASTSRAEAANLAD